MFNTMNVLKYSSLSLRRSILLIGTALASVALSGGAALATEVWVAEDDGAAADWNDIGNWKYVGCCADANYFSKNGANPRAYIDIKTDTGLIKFESTLYGLDIRAAGVLSINELENTEQARITITNDGSFSIARAVIGPFNIINSGSLLLVDRANAGAGSFIDNSGTVELTKGASLDRAELQNAGGVRLGGNSTAGASTIINKSSGVIEFVDYAAAGNAKITNSGTISVKDRSSLGSAHIANNNILTLSDYAAMADAKIENAGDMSLTDYSSLGNATINNDGELAFAKFSGAGNASLNNASAGVIRFNENTSAANAKLNNAGKIFFSDFSTGANAAVTNAATGDVDISGLAAGGMPLGALAGGGTVSLGSRSLSVGGNNTSTLFSGVLQDGGASGGVGGSLVKEGTGKLSLSGVQTYTGATDINAGNLNVNGSLESSSIVNVNKGGTLSGGGKFGNVNNNGGTISPGNSIGTIHIDGNLNMGPNSKYYVEINGDASDRIEVTGTANIQSAIFEIAHDSDRRSSPVLPGKTYTLITTNGGLTVTAPQVAIADFPFLSFSLSTDAFNGYLTTSRSSERFADLATTANEKAVANALDNAPLANPLWQQVVGASEAQARAAFTSLSNASIHANAAGVLSEQSRYLRDAVTGRMRQDFASGTATPASNALTYAPEARSAYAATGKGPFHKAPPAVAPVPAQVYAVWAQGIGSWGALKGDGNAATTDHSLGGVISGLDVTFDGRWRAGFAGGYSHSIFDSPSIAASGSSESYHVALYGGGQLGAWGLRGGASFSWSDVTTSRHVAVINLTGSQRGDYAATTTQVFGEAGHSFDFASGAIEPFANIAYVRVDGGIKELGIAAISGDTKIDTTYTTLGLRGSTALTGALTARGTLAWRHAFGDVVPVAALAFQSGGTAFSLAGSPIARDALVAEAGLDFAVAVNTAIGMSWSGQFADGSHSNAVKGNFTWKF